MESDEPMTQSEANQDDGMEEPKDGNRVRDLALRTWHLGDFLVID